MKIFGFKIVWFDKHNKVRRRRTGWLERLVEKDLFDTALKNQEVMATLLGKYGATWVANDDAIENTKQEIKDKFYRTLELKALAKRRRELDYRITDIISRVIPGGKNPGVGLSEAEAPSGLKLNKENISSYATRSYRTPGQRFANLLSLLKALERLASATALANSATNKERKDGANTKEKMYIPLTDKQIYAQQKHEKHS